MTLKQCHDARGWGGLVIILATVGWTFFSSRFWALGIIAGLMIRLYAGYREAKLSGRCW